ncbi:MAG: elongation factor G [Gammaproteobacteria bacterium]|nr:elongation factor G [Gammaproteobacteria bacterium]
MPAYATNDIRNIALVGNTGVGKTSLIEALFLEAGVLRQKGSIAKGTTLCDYLPQEKQHQHSLHPKVVSLDHRGRHINLLDTPGAPDLFGRALAMLPAVETVAVVIDARTGPDVTARRMMEQAAARSLDRIVVVSHIDAEDVDLERCLATIQDVFGAHCLPLNLPASKGAAVVDCYFAPAGGATDFSTVAEAHTRLVDQVVEVDEALMQVYLEQGEELKPEQLHDAFEAALRESHLIPVCFVSAQTGAGVAELLRVVTDLMPNPTEGVPPVFYDGDGSDARPVHFTADPAKHVLAHVFKVAIDPFVGRTAHFRVHQGTITKDGQLFIGTARKALRVAHLFKPQGKDLQEVDAAIPGDICALAKIDDLVFDSVLHDSHDEDHIHLQSIAFPPPMHGVAVTTKSRGDEQKISDALHKLRAEDPSLVIDYNPTLNETVLRAMGELHLRVLLEDLRERFHVDVSTSPPKVPYRETITAGGEGHYRHKKQTGGAGQFAEVYLRVQPLARGEGFRFVDQVVGGAIPRQFIPAVEKGVRQALRDGAFAGYELHDLEVQLYDGKFHPVDSKEVAFVTAGRKAFVEAVQAAQPVLLEPIVRLDVVAPSGSVGDVTRDLTGKRARINSTDAAGGGFATVSAQVPLSELEGYQAQLKSMTAGAGSYTIEFSHYDRAPAKLQSELVAAYRPAASDD